MVKIYKLSVTDILKLYFFNTLVCYNSKSSGIKEHKINGYNNTKIYERYYPINLENIILVYGIPDRIDPPYLVEFKTCSTKTLDAIVDYSTIQLQLYMFLTGLTKGRLDIYLKDKKVLIKGYLYTDYDENLVKDVILKAYKNLNQNS